MKEELDSLYIRGNYLSDSYNEVSRAIILADDK